MVEPTRGEGEFPFLEWISSHSFPVPEILEWIFSPSFPFPNFGKIKFYRTYVWSLPYTKSVSHCSCLELIDVAQKDAEFMQPLLVNVELNCWICKSLTKSLKNVEINCWICQSCYTDFCKLLPGFVNIDTWIFLGCYMDIFATWIC